MFVQGQKWNLNRQNRFKRNIINTVTVVNKTILYKLNSMILYFEHSYKNQLSNEQVQILMSLIIQCLKCKHTLKHNAICYN